MALKPEVLTALSSLKTREEIHEAFDFLKQISSAQRQQVALTAIATGAIRVGMRVTFPAKHGQILTGLVTKLNRTTATVKADQIPGIASPNPFYAQNWRVSISILKAA